MPTIVFVHLNSKIPKYLKLNLSGMTKLFPNQKIILIHNQEKIYQSIPGVTLFKFEESQIFLDIQRSLSHPKDFRNNFWFTTIGRFEALHQYIELTGEKIIHVESDVILARDFPFSKFDDLPFDLAFPLVASNRGVASTLFINDLESAKELVIFSLAVCQDQPDISDMEILSRIVSHSKLKILLLPITHPDKSSFHENNGYPDLVSLEYGIQKFGGIFDGNDIGVYLYGTNPRNSRGISDVGQEVIGNFASIGLWRFRYNQSRDFIDQISGTETFPVFSIHATCKKLSLFWPKTRKFNLRHFHTRRSGVKKLYFNVTLLMAMTKCRNLICRLCK